MPISSDVPAPGTKTFVIIPGAKNEPLPDRPERHPEPVVIHPDSLARTRIAAMADMNAIRRVADRFPMRITPEFLALIQQPGDPIWKQVIPDEAELADHDGDPDPLREEEQSPAPNLIHRYPDRVLLITTNRCALHCRHCMRKRTWTRPAAEFEQHEEALRYIRKTTSLREVVLSGGDPLMLKDDHLFGLLNRLKQIPHVEILRIHTRVPCVTPGRVTVERARRLSLFHPLYIHIQFNHPTELTPAVALACARLADAGIPLGSQTVLLKGVNDDPHVMLALMRRLLAVRVRPYYLHHVDPVRGAVHFRTSISLGRQIMRHLQGRLSGIGIPTYMLDLPGGGGKIPLTPEYLRKEEEAEYHGIND